ncbi:hypothetical protein GCM10027162_39490 [Streptomyces incanus]
MDHRFRACPRRSRSPTTAKSSSVRPLAGERPRARLRSRAGAPGSRRDPVLARRLRELLDERAVEGLGLAEAAGLPPAHPAPLVRAFSGAYGIASHRYLMSRRVGRARRLLLDGRAPSEVAVATGFYDQTHLTRPFRKLVGVTPGRYRAEGR